MMNLARYASEYHNRPTFCEMGSEYPVPCFLPLCSGIWPLRLYHGHLWEGGSDSEETVIQGELNLLTTLRHGPH